MPHYIYGLREVGTTEFRYIGQAIDLIKRAHAHKNNKQDTELGEWLRSTYWEMQPLAKVQDPYEAGVLEARTISKRRQAGDRLLNKKRGTPTVRRKSNKRGWVKVERMTKKEREEALMAYILANP